MGHWNYRIVKESKEALGEIETYYLIKEVHYDDYNIPKGSGKAFLYSEEGVSDFRWMLAHMQEACNKPVLEYDEELKRYMEVEE